MNLSPSERATTITMDDEGDTAYVITYQKSRITQLRKNTAAEEISSKVVLEFGGAEFNLPKQLVSFRNPRKVADIPLEDQEVLF